MRKILVLCLCAMLLTGCDSTTNRNMGSGFGVWRCDQRSGNDRIAIPKRVSGLRDMQSADFIFIWNFL